MLVLSRSNPDLADVSFDNDVTSIIITGGTWQLHSRFNYQGNNVTLGQGHYPTASRLYPIANDDLSSVQYVGKSSCKVQNPKTTLSVCYVYITSLFARNHFCKLPDCFVLFLDKQV